MGLETYETVTFKDRLMMAVEQIRAVDKKLEKLSRKLKRGQLVADTLLGQCQEELRDCQNTLLTLHKEILYYISQ